MKRPEEKIRNDHEAAIWEYIDHQEGIIAELAEAAGELLSVLENPNLDFYGSEEIKSPLTAAIQKAKEATK